MKTLYESILDDPDIITNKLDSINENPFKYLAGLDSDVWGNPSKIQQEFELFRTAITKDCKIKPGYKARSEKYKIAFGDNPKEPRIYIKCGPYTHFICQSMKWERDYYLSLRTISPRYGAKHFQNCDVYIPSKKLIDQYEEFKNIIRRAVDAYDGIKDLETLKEYVK